MAIDGEWQMVSRRRNYPDNWRYSKPQQPTVTPYLPYTSYAEVVRRNCNPSSAMSSDSSPKTTPPTSRPATPTTPPATLYYVSPHSPSRLRFPPSSTFSEWKGRCFRCCRTGHTRAKCRNPRRCGRCWSYGHIGSQCKQPLVPPPQPALTAQLWPTHRENQGLKSC